MGKPPGGGSGEGTVSLGVHVLSTAMGSGEDQWAGAGRCPRHHMSLCVCVGGGSWQGEWARALARRAAESLCAPVCRSSLSNRVLGAGLFCLYAPVGLAFLSLGEQCLWKSFSTLVWGEWNRDLS